MLVSKCVALEKFNEFFHKGYLIYRADVPAHAIGGFFAENKKQQSTNLIEYNLFDEEYICEESIVSPDELILFAESNSVYSCDNPKKLLIGFVYYDRKNKKSIVKQTNVFSIRILPKSKLDYLLKIRDIIKRKSELFYQIKSGIKMS